MDSSGGSKITSFLCLLLWLGMLEGWSQLRLQPRMSICDLFSMVLLGYSEHLHNHSEFLQSVQETQIRKRPQRELKRQELETNLTLSLETGIGSFLTYSIGQSSYRVYQDSRRGHRIHISTGRVLKNLQPSLIFYANLESYFLY